MQELQKYKIQNIITQTYNTLLFQLVPLEGNIFSYKPGQFAMINIYNDDWGIWNKKAYSMSSSPINKDYLEFGIKIQGDFTQKMATLKIGGIVGIEGPYGSFTYDKELYKNTIMFAGGIGITPFISMNRFAQTEAPQNKITIFYCNQTEKDIAYKSILDELNALCKNLSCIYLVDKAITPNWQGETGLISETIIKKYTANLLEYNIILMCGPLSFMKAVEDILIKNNIPKERIKREVF